MSVEQFRGDNFYLSNMYQCEVPMHINGKLYRFSSVEAAFQAHKDSERVGEFVGISGKDAKKLGRQVNMRRDWENIKDDVMRDCVRSKFENNPELAAKLKSTEGLLVENNTWGDRYWGMCGGVGQNKLGQILMEERDSLLTKSVVRTKESPNVPEEESKTRPTSKAQSASIKRDVSQDGHEFDESFDMAGWNDFGVLF